LKTNELEEIFMKTRIVSNSILTTNTIVMNLEVASCMFLFGRNCQFSYILSRPGSTLRLRFNLTVKLTVNVNLLQLWPNFLKVEKLSALRFLLHGHLLDRLEVLGGKVVEVVLQLPNLCLPHLDQRVLVNSLLVPGVLDMLLPGLLEEVSGAFEKGRQQQLKDLVHAGHVFCLSNQKVMLRQSCLCSGQGPL